MNLWAAAAVAGELKVSFSLVLLIKTSGVICGGGCHPRRLSSTVHQAVPMNAHAQIFYSTLLIGQITHSTAKWSRENIHFLRYKMINQLAASHPMLSLLGPFALSLPHCSARTPILIHAESLTCCEDSSAHAFEAERVALSRAYL